MTSKTPAFLLGAGFNADAKVQVGPVYGESIYIGKHEIQCAYPLLGDLAQLCFGLPSPPADKSIEELFHESLETQQFEPLSLLAHALMKADYYLAPRLLPTPGVPSHCYSRFFERFAGAQFLTFNYDSLPEVFLLCHGRWYPHDGYGVPVVAEVAPGHDHVLEQSSASLVLHLHGSLCLYTSTFTFDATPGQQVSWYKKLSEPKFLFDPDSISNLFTPFQRLPPVLGYEPIERRVVAPVPDKSQGLKKEFTDAVYRRAAELVSSSAAPLVAIGYSFNPYDRTSYDTLLRALKSRNNSLLVVSPDAAAIRSRLSYEYPDLQVHVVPSTFKAWAAADFVGAS